MAVSANKAAAIAYVACAATWATFFTMAGTARDELNQLLAGSYTLIVSTLCAAFVHELFRKTS